MNPDKDMLLSGEAETQLRESLKRCSPETVKAAMAYRLDKDTAHVPVIVLFCNGVIEAGEDAATAGLRELREETGFRAKSIRPMGKVYPNPALQNNTCHYLLAEGAELWTETQWDEHEQIEVCLLPVEEVMRQALDGRINHALAINALHFFGPFREEQNQA